MKKLRKYLSVLLLMSVFFLCACSTYANKSYTFNVSTGEQIVVTLNVKEGYDLSQADGQFTVSDKDGNDILTGIFLLEGYTDSYREVVDADPDATVLEDKSTGGITYLYYEYDGETGMEHNFIVDIDGAKTGVLLASQASLARCNRFTVPITLLCTKISGLEMLRSTWLSAAKLIT